MTETVYISVDVETSGPDPCKFDLQSIGAVVLDEQLDETFYVEIKPIFGNFLEGAIEKTKLTPSKLQNIGVEPSVAMKNFEIWIRQVSQNSNPVFLGFGATFDWKWIDSYFQRFLGHNPFGINGMDIKSYYAGKFNLNWSDTTKAKIAMRGIVTNRKHTHNALDDAIEQAELFKLIKEKEVY